MNSGRAFFGPAAQTIAPGALGHNSAREAAVSARAKRIKIWRPEEDAIETAAAIIPAFNEEATVADVVRAAQEAKLVGEIVVVDNASTDRTAEVAAAAGARLIPNPVQGKGESMKVGVDATAAEVIVFLDADLLGLKPRHIDALVEPVLNRKADMVCGLFDRGPILNHVFLNYLPVLTGERAVSRRLFDRLDVDDLKGYKVEASLNAACADLGLKRVHFVCDGMWHLVKEKKFANPVEGFVRKILMLTAAIWSYAYYSLRHRLAPRLWTRIRGYKRDWDAIRS